MYNNLDNGHFDPRFYRHWGNTGITMRRALLWVMTIDPPSYNLGDITIYHCESPNI